jgi:alcohol dehydrogenase class IV
MLAASAMGATAFQKGLGAIHALAHPLGALYDAHHGLLNAILMPYVLQANRPAIQEATTLASRYLGLSDPGFDSFLGWVLALREEVGIPDSLAQIGIETDAAARVGAMAFEDPSAAGNPRQFDAAEYSAIFTRAVRGILMAR